MSVAAAPAKFDFDRVAETLPRPRRDTFARADPRIGDDELAAMRVVERANALNGADGVRDVELFDETSTAVATNLLYERFQPGFTAGAGNHGAPAACEREREAAADARGSTRHQCAHIPISHPVPLPLPRPGLKPLDNG